MQQLVGRKKAVITGMVGVGLALALTASSTMMASAEEAVVTPMDSAGPYFQTANGTADIVVPETWSIDDTSYAIGEGQDARWQNDILFTSDEGVEVRYFDGFGDYSSAGKKKVKVVDRRETAQGFYATSWWERSRGEYTPFIGVSHRKTNPESYFELDNINRIHIFEVTDISDETFRSKRQVERFLKSPEYRNVLDVMETIVLNPVDENAMPPGYEAPIEDSWEFTTQNGSASFMVPGGFTLDDDSSGDPQSDDYLNHIILQSPYGYGAFSDSSPGVETGAEDYDSTGVVEERHFGEDSVVVARVNELTGYADGTGGDASVQDAGEDPQTVYDASLILATVIERDESGNISKIAYGSQNGGTFSEFSGYSMQFETEAEAIDWIQGSEGEAWISMIASVQFHQ